MILNWLSNKKAGWYAEKWAKPFLSKKVKAMQISSSQLLQSETKQLIQGPAGSIEVAASQASVPTGQILVCHPHPLYAGTMFNKVVTTVIKQGNNSGMSTCRFNYRGVGESRGEYDYAKGEVDDTLAVANWFIGQNPEEPPWRAG